jgi:hypothetical protein
MYGGASIIKSRLLPFLGQNFFTSGGSVTADTSISVLAEAAAKNREIDELQDMYETSLTELEADLKDKEAENQDLKDEYVLTAERVVVRQGRKEGMGGGGNGNVIVHSWVNWYTCIFNP